MPSPELLAEARSAALKHGAKLLLCFGGNGRSAGFSAMSRSKAARRAFVESAAGLVEEAGLDGIDINWEYPGYSFGSGYGSAEDVKTDWAGLGALAQELRTALPSSASLTAAYYPDGRQEALLLEHGVADAVDYLHMMTYDQQGAQHASLEFALGAMAQGAKVLPRHKLTLGLPFYGRHSATGDWTTYEDIVQKHHPLRPGVDSVPAEGGGSIGFNGRHMIENKTRAARSAGLGGVMIWEAGQDCRRVAVTHTDDKGASRTHGVTCPTPESSLLAAISEALGAPHEVAHGGAEL